MGTSGGPNNKLMQPVTQANISGLVIDQLVLYCDAARLHSYNNGSSWNDISNNNKNITLYNAGGSTYSSNSPGPPNFSTGTTMGEFLFDGTNDWGKFSSIDVLSTCTLSVWCKFTNTDRRGIISHCSGGPVNLAYTVNGGKMEYWNYDGAWQVLGGTSFVNTGTWKNLVWSKETSTSMKMYINGTLDQTSTVSNTTGPLACIASMWGPCNSDSYGAGTDSYGSVFNGSIAVIMFHNKGLTSAEISKNYNALKSRF